MMFEVEDLSVASPATVSRCGMIYMEPVALGLKPLFNSWANTLPEPFKPQKVVFERLFDAYAQDAVTFARKNVRETVATVDGNLCLSLFRLIDSVIAGFLNELKTASETESEEGAAASRPSPEGTVKSIFFFSLIWSIGASCDLDGRHKFSTFLRERMLENLHDKDIPAERSIYDYCYLHSLGQHGWTPWMDTMPEFKLDPKLEFSSILVPTVDTIRYTNVLGRLVRKNHHVLCVGNTGTGKTLAVMDLLLNSMGKHCDTLPVSFSASTSANQTQDILDARMDKRRKGVFGPPAGMKYIIMVDDFNMPMREKYFAQPPIELLRQWMDHSG
eukprot:3876744-Rhodomonas_salina.2